MGSRWEADGKPMGSRWEADWKPIGKRIRSPHRPSLRKSYKQSLGSDAALKSRDNLCFFEDVGVEGFFAF
jgi:hypothetical protein